MDINVDGGPGWTVSAHCGRGVKEYLDGRRWEMELPHESPWKRPRETLKRSVGGPLEERRSALVKEELNRD